MTITFYPQGRGLKSIGHRFRRTATLARTMVADFRFAPVARRAEEAVLALEPLGPSVVDGAVLIDGCFWHPNYWLRYGMLRAAWGLHNAPAVGIVGRYARPAVNATMKRFGISRPWQFGDRLDRSGSGKKAAERYLAKTRRAEDILEWDLPKGVPGFDIYDGLLKIQRSATVDLNHPDVLNYVSDWFAHLDAFERMLDETAPALAILSHTQSARDFYGVFAACLLDRGIEIVVPRGGFGTLQHYRVRSQDDLYTFNNGVSPEEIGGLDDRRAEKLRQVGQQALSQRFGGKSSEFAGILAFGSDTKSQTRAEICRQFGWKVETPLVVILSSTWFDFPHIYGATRFRDFEEWIRATVAAAAGGHDINFLVRGHPVDRWYNNVFIGDLVGETKAKNIGICPYGINGSSILQAVDAAITYYGTAGIEYPAFEKPVMVADRGWYHRHSFAYLPQSRADYLADVGRQWWRGRNLSAAAGDAQIYAGFRFGRPAWQERLTYQDDVASSSPEIAARMPELVNNAEGMARELDALRRWYYSDQQLYHAFKMLEADDYVF